jgi:hypothetical protein
MTWIAPGRRRIIGAAAALMLVLTAIGVASPASATSGGGSVEPQGVCAPTWWIHTSTGSGNQDSPLFYYVANSSIQFKVTNIYNYKRTNSDCSVRYTKGGQAAKYRICSSATSCNNWRNVSKGCAVEPTKYKGYNYGAGGCYFWYA